MTSEALTNKQEKYYFNMNIFDEDGEDEHEEDVAPVFSEEELEQARQKGFQEGKAQGLAEAEESRNQIVAHALDVISQHMTVLLEAETKREDIFEKETVRLTLTIFDTLFPLYQAQHGQNELIHSMKTILESQRNQREILVTTSPQTTEGVQKMLSALSERGINAKFTVTSDENIPETACKLAWADGGAIINHQQLAQEIKATMQQVLAGGATNRHDGEEQNDGTADAVGAEAGERGTQVAQNEHKDADIMENPDE